MWKCQNLLRHQVKDLVDLIKQPKVSEYAIILKNKTKQKLKKPTTKKMEFSYFHYFRLKLNITDRK